MFNTDSASVKAYEMVRKSFEHWCWGTGYRLNTIFSDCLVEDYYNKLISTAKLNNSKLKNIRFILQVVYQIPPDEWEVKNANSIIISPMDKLPAAEDIFCVCKA